jgi:hypothetical protein
LIGTSKPAHRTWKPFKQIDSKINPMHSGGDEALGATVTNDGNRLTSKMIASKLKDLVNERGVSPLEPNDDASRSALSQIRKLLTICNRRRKRLLTIDSPHSMLNEA